MIVLVAVGLGVLVTRSPLPDVDVKQLVPEQPPVLPVNVEWVLDGPRPADSASDDHASAVWRDSSAVEESTMRLGYGVRKYSNPVSAAIEYRFGTRPTADDPDVDWSAPEQPGVHASSSTMYCRAPRHIVDPDGTGKCSAWVYRARYGQYIVQLTLDMATWNAMPGDDFADFVHAFDQDFIARVG